MSLNSTSEYNEEISLKVGTEGLQ